MILHSHEDITAAIAGCYELSQNAYEQVMRAIEALPVAATIPDCKECIGAAMNPRDCAECMNIKEAKR